MNFKIFTISIFIMFMVISAVERAAGAVKTSPLVIKWEKTEGCEQYHVQIMNSQDTIVLDRTVTTNQIEFVLPVGMYRIRVAAINIFGKVSFQSEWDTFEIRQARKWIFFTNDYLEKVGLKVSGGMAYVMLLPPWNRLYKNTYNNYRCVFGFHFGNSQFVKSPGAARFLGIELEGNFSHYNDRETIFFNSRMKNYTGGLNLFVKTNLTIPLNFYLGVGGGISYSEQNYTRYYIASVPPWRSKIHTLDPYCKASAGIEINFLYTMSLNIQADYYAIFYQDKINMSLRFCALMGIRI